MLRREPVHSSEIWRQVPALSTLLCALLLLPGAGVAQDDGVNALLEAAMAAEASGHLIYPASGSAMSLYHEVLYRAPDNAEAIAGLGRLAEQQLEDAQAALDAGQLIKADSLLSKARMIYPEYPGIEPVRRQLALLENAERTRRTLDWRLVAERSPRLTPELMQLGRLAKADDCRVTISVSNDAEGRWVYQQMNGAEGPGRVHAAVKIASPAAVDVLCFRDDPGAPTDAH
jgi:hypothetical protein